MKKIRKSGLRVLLMLLFLASGILVGGRQEARAAIYKPEAPVVKGTAVGRKITLSWPRVKAADGYQVLVYHSSTKRYRWYKTYATKEAQISRSFYGKSNMTYRYKVYAYRMVNGKRVMGKASSIVTVNTIPDPATRVIAARINMDGECQIHWTTNKYANGYKIYRSENGRTFRQIKLIPSRAVGTYVDKDIKSEGVTYSYRVRAFRRNTGSVVYGRYANTMQATSYQKQEYAKVFVGDSRTFIMEKASGRPDDTKWINEVGAGCKWLRETADGEISEVIGQGSNLIIWMGVNDADKISEYIKYYNSRIPEWKKMGTKVYLVTVGPLDEDPFVTNEDIAEFNKKLKAGVTGAKIIDVHSYLLKNGYKTYDGIHYDESMSQKIYRYILAQL